MPFIEEVLEAGRSRAGDTIFLGVDASCDVDNVEDQRSTLVRDLRCCQGLFAAFQGTSTLCWKSPEGSSRKKKVDFVVTNQATASVAIRGATTNRSVLLDARLMESCWSLRVKGSRRLVGFHRRCFRTMTSRSPSLSSLFWASRSVTCNKCLRTPSTG